DLASAQTPPFSSQRRGPHRFERGDFLRGSLSFAAKRFSAVFDAAPCFGGAFHIENSILLTQMPVIVDEELFQLLHEFLAKVADVLYVGVAVIFFLNADDPIVALLVFFLALLALDHANYPAFHKNSGESRLVHQDQNVCRIAILSFCRRNKTEVVWEGHAGGQHLLKRKHVLFGIERELVPAAFRSFNDHLDSILNVLIEGSQACWVGESAA